LRDEGTIELRAGRGAHVRRVAPRQAVLVEEIDALLRAAAREGLAGDEIVALVQSRARGSDRGDR